MTSFGMKPLPVGRELQRPARNRRRRIRHKAHTPAFAGMNANSTGIALDLYEILDLSEEGMCFQSSSRMEPGEELALCLDLSEPRTYIHTGGRVTWSHPSGRTGLRFQKMPDADVRQIREWLLVNLLSRAAECQALMEPETAAEPVIAAVLPPPVSEDQDETVELSIPVPDEEEQASILSSMEAMRQEVQSSTGDLDEALLVIVERTQALTRATGAAIALSSGEDMVCRATSGSDAPGLGARLQAESGFSGECVRTGKLLHCDDSEIDPRVDRDSCRALGIRSIMAAPIRSEDRVIGLLEVFAPEPRAFGESDKITLQEVAEIIEETIGRAIQAMAFSGDADENALPASNGPENNGKRDPFDTSTDDPDSFGGTSFKSASVKRIFMIAGFVLSAVVLWWVIGGQNENNVNASDANSEGRALTSQVIIPKAASRGMAITDLKHLRSLAQQGDAVAQFSLGVRYATGEEVKQDYREAAHWFSLAADQGHVMAQSTLGAYYWAGRGVSQDLSKAYFWAVLANTGGDEASKVRLSFLASRLGRREILSVQQQASDWLKEHQLANAAAE